GLDRVLPMLQVNYQAMGSVAGKCRFEFDVVFDLQNHAGLSRLKVCGADSLYQMTVGFYIFRSERRWQLGVEQGKENTVRIAEPLRVIADFAAQINHDSRAIRNGDVTNRGNFRGRSGGRIVSFVVSSLAVVCLDPA